MLRCLLTLNYIVRRLLWFPEALMDERAVISMHVCSQPHQRAQLYLPVSLSRIQCMCHLFTSQTRFFPLFLLSMGSAAKFQSKFFLFLRVPLPRSHPLVPLHLKSHLQQPVTLPETPLCHSWGWMHKTLCRLKTKDCVEKKAETQIQTLFVRFIKSCVCMVLFCESQSLWNWAHLHIHSHNDVGIPLITCLFINTYVCFTIITHGHRGYLLYLYYYSFIHHKHNQK